jgi:hydrogenase expression/formation protein HypE
MTGAGERDRDGAAGAGDGEPSLGKVDAAFFERVIYPQLGADRTDVAVGPQHGVDFGVLTIGDAALVAATDPLSVLPELGVERAGRLALDIVTTDVAVSGIAPSHATVALTLPPAMSDALVADIWDAIATHAADLGITIMDVHIGRYSGIEGSWVGGATALGVGDAADVVRPDGATPGDVVVLSTGPAAEVAGLFSWLFPDALGLSADDIATARERVDDIAATADAVAAHGAGDITAMHDATEGGVVGGLVEMATGAGVRLDVASEAAPLRPGVEAVCRAIDVDPWRVTSAGSLLMTVAPGDADAVVAALDERGTPAAAIGTVTTGEGVFLDDEPVTAPATDASWAAMAELRDER